MPRPRSYAQRIADLAILTILLVVFIAFAVLTWPVAATYEMLKRDQ